MFKAETPLELFALFRGWTELYVNTYLYDLAEEEYITPSQILTNLKKRGSGMSAAVDP